MTSTLQVVSMWNWCWCVQMKNDIEELKEMYGLLCWQGYEHDPGGCNKFMWYSIMKEFNCKVSSTKSNDDRTKDASFTHRKHEEKLSQMDLSLGKKGRHDDCFFCNEGMLWDSWDHYPISARIQEERDSDALTGKRKKKWCGWNINRIHEASRGE